MKIVTEDNWLHGSHSNWVYSEEKYGLVPHNQLGCTEGNYTIYRPKTWRLE